MKNYLNRLSTTFLVWTLVVAAFFVLAVVSVAFFAARVPVARATGNITLKGWAWSSTIGWISFNSANTNSGGGSNYSVKEYLTNGQLSGHAWSSNIGWISFNQSDLSGCPSGSGSGSCVAKVTGGKVTGWARALAANPNGGWTGWISFSGTTKDGKSSYGVKQSSGGAWSDFAWGGKVMGWVKFSGTVAGTKYCVSENGSCTVPAPQITLFRATPASVSSGGSSTLGWTSLNTTSCTAGGAWSGTPIATSGSKTVTPSTSSTYMITCSGPGGSISRSVTITVGSSSPPPSSTSSSGLSGILTAFPTMVNKGVSTNIRLNWTINGNGKKGNLNSSGLDCRLTENGSSMSNLGGSLTSTKQQDTGIIYKDVTLSHQAVYKIVCGSANKVLAKVLVNLVPQYSSF